jgi:hypothetical protein
MSALKSVFRIVGNYMVTAALFVVAAGAVLIGLCLTLLPFAFYGFLLYLAYLMVMHFTGVA